MVIAAEGILLDIVSMLERMVLICGVCRVPVTKHKRALICGWILFMGLCKMDIWQEYQDRITLIFRVCMAPLIILLWTEGNVIRRLAVYICSVMYLHTLHLVFDLLAEIILACSASCFAKCGIYRILRAICTVILMAAFAIVLRKISGYTTVLYDIPTKYFVLGSVGCMSVFLIQHYMKEQSTAVYGETEQSVMITGYTALISGMFCILGAGAAVLNSKRKKYKLESERKDEYLRITREYVRMIKKNAAETRRMHHDFQAHIGSLWYYMQKKDYRKAEDYLSSIREHLTDAVYKIEFVNHEIVDAILLERQIQGKYLNIHWQIEGILPADLPISDFDLCTIFSNLLVNSVEACEKLPQDQREIHLEIRKFGTQLLIEMENPVIGEIRFQDLERFSSKTDVWNHGFGIANVKAAVEKNHGEISFV